MFNIDFNTVSSAIILGLTGIIGYSVKEIPSYIFKYFDQKYSINIQVNSESVYVYFNTMEWILDKFPSLNNHLEIDGFRNGTKILSNGIFYFFPNKRNFVIINKQFIQGPSSNINCTLNIYVLGCDRFKYLEDYNSYLEKKMPNKSKYLNISVFEIEGRTSGFFTPKKSFDDVYFDKKELLIKILNMYNKKSNIYKDHGLNKSIGILLYGPPGTGKTTIAKAIASYLNFELTYIKKTCKMLPSYIGDTVILFEDIDTMISKDEVNRDKNYDKDDKSTFYSNGISLHEMLNYIDGCLTPNNTIMIATTNHPEKLDSALLREGRFDYKFEIKYMDYKYALEMCNRFNMDKSILDGIKFPCSPAIVQNKILNYILTNDDEKNKIKKEKE